MQIYEIKPEEQQWLYEPVLVFNRSDKPFRGTYAKKDIEIPAGHMASIPRATLIFWAGNPKLRKDPKQWYREIQRVKFQNGEGTSFFDHWFKDGKLAIPDFQNHKPGYYSTQEHERKWEQVGQPIPTEYLKLPELPSHPMVTAFEDADFEKFDAMVRNKSGGGRPDDVVGESFGGETSVDDDLGNAIEAARMTNDGSQPRERKVTARR